MLRAVFLDFGGTLAYESVRHSEYVRTALARLGHVVSDAGAEAVIEGGRSWQDDCPHPREEGLDVRDRWWRRWYAAGLEAVGLDPTMGDALWEGQELGYTLYPEVVEALEALRGAGLNLGIISNWEKDTLPGVCRKLGIADYFQPILASAVAGCDKPNPKIFRQAMEALQVAPQDAAMVGDSLGADVKGAEGVGIVGVWIDRGGQGSSEPVPTFPDLAAAARWLLEGADR